MDISLEGWDIARFDDVDWVPWGSGSNARAKLLAVADGFHVAHDVDVSWWVTPEAYERGAYRTLYAGLRRRLADDFPFENPHYSNREIPD